VIFVATLVWLAIDFSLMKEGKSQEAKKEETSASTMKK
jgi:hypothetical protein